jgi:hypothetical protein
MISEHWTLFHTILSSSVLCNRVVFTRNIYRHTVDRFCAVHEICCVYREKSLYRGEIDRLRRRVSLVGRIFVVSDFSSPYLRMNCAVQFPERGGMYEMYQNICCQPFDWRSCTAEAMHSIDGITKPWQWGI